MPADENKILTIKKIAGGDNAGAFAPSLLKNVWPRAFKGSVMAGLAGSVPLEMNGNVITVPVGQPTAGIVAELGEKPVSTLAYKTVTMAPIKAALVILMSEEAIKANPLGAFDDLEKQMSEGISRAIDNAIIHGKDALTGSEIPGVTGLVSTTKSATMNLTEAKPGALYAELVDALALVTDDDSTEGEYDVTHMVARTSVRTAFMKATDSTGRPLYQASPDVTDKMGTIAGLPVSYTKAVKGYEQVNDATLLGIAGDFRDNLRLGYVNSIEWKQATEFAGGIDLFTRNMRAILAEIHFGWAIRDKAAFVKITSA